MTGKALVVDANILVRAVLGKRVRTVIETYCDSVSFFVPEAAYAEAEEHLQRLTLKHGGDPEKALAFLRTMRHLVELIGSDVYGEFEGEARERLGKRDPDDLPDSCSFTGASLANLDRKHRLLLILTAYLAFPPPSL